MYKQFEIDHYRIQLWIPDESPPEQGFSLLFVLDGARYGLMIHEVLKLQLRNRIKTKVKPLIIVGIDSLYDTDDPRHMEFRAFHYTPSNVANYQFPPMWSERNMKAAGSCLIHKLIEQKIKPALLQLEISCNLSDCYLFGHSLGGLYVTWAYLENHPFKGFVAVSPSLWWHEQRLLENIIPNESPIAIYVGEQEGDMVAQAKVLYDAISTTSNKHEYYVPQYENHASVIPTVLSRALRFIASIDD